MQLYHTLRMNTLSMNSSQTYLAYALDGATLTASRRPRNCTGRRSADAIGAAHRPSWAFRAPTIYSRVSLIAEPASLIDMV